MRRNTFCGWGTTIVAVGLAFSPSPACAWPVMFAWVAAQAPPSTDPFAPKPKPPADSPPAGPSKTSGDSPTPSTPNPFSPKPTSPTSDAGTKPFAPKGTTPASPNVPPKPTSEPAKPPAEVVVGSAWTVTPDPSPRPVLNIAPQSITAPGSAASSDVTRERKRFRVITANVPASVVGLGLNEKEADARDIWDLEANRKLGTVKGLALEASRLMALSPDGLLFAAKPQFDDFVVVVNVATGKTLKTIPLAGVRLELLAFSAPNRLLLAEDGRLLVHSLPDGRREREIPIENWTVRDGWTLSPGGKYLAVVLRENGDRQLATFIDLTTGLVAGQCRPTPRAGDCLGIAITRDGQRLATVVDDGGGARISQIELATPKRLKEITLAGAELFAEDGYQGPVIEWLPDGKHLLLAGRTAVDTALGEVARTLPPPPPSPLLTIGPAVTLAFNGRELAPMPLGLSIDPALTTPVKPIPMESASGPLVGPMLKPADLNTSIRKTLGPAGRWDVKLAASPVVPTKLDTDGFKVPGGYIHQALLAPGTPPIAVVSYAAAPLQNGTSSETKTWAEVFDVQSGEPRQRVDFTVPTVATSISPGAKMLASLSQDGHGRVDVWSVEDGQHLGGFQPAGSRPDHQGPWMVEFIDAEHLLIAVADELSLWEIPACRQLYSLPIGAIRPVLSPGRDYVVVSVPGESRVAAVETISGNMRGSIATSALPGDRPMSAAFHPSGRKAAVMSGGADGGEILIIDMNTGRETSRLRIPVNGDVLQFCGDEHLLVGGETLVSLTREGVVWRYELPTGMHSRDTLGGLHWYIAAINPSDKTYIMYGASLPEEAARKEIEASSRRPQTVFQPTDSVRVEVLAADLAAPHIVKHLKETFTKRYADAGIKTAEDAGFAFTIDPGRMGILKTSVWKVSLVQAGQPIWVSWIHATPQGALLMASEPTGAAARFADPPEIRTALAALLKFEPPKYAFSRSAITGIGESQLTTSGPRPRK